MPEAIALTKAELKEILAANHEGLLEIIREMKKPTPQEQRQLDAMAKEIEQQQKERKANSEAILRKIANKRAIQKSCSHEHPNGDSHCVYVMESSGPGYILCQKNQCIIRPGEAPKDYKGDAIYSTTMFSSLFQKLRTTGADIIG